MKQQATFGVIGAMSIEIEKLRSLLRGGETQELAGLAFYTGQLGENRVVLVRSGIGKVNAARCAQLLIDRFAPDYIINTGIAGGVGAGLSIADIVIGTELVQHDFDVTFFGYGRGNLCQSKDGSPTVFSGDPELIDAFRRTAEALVGPERVKTGRIASGDQFIAQLSVKRDIARTFGALAAEMEGAAIAQTAALSHVPFVVVRAISDLADGSEEAQSETFDRDAANLSAQILERLIRG